MKKFILTVALVLAVVTSLVAGTMAAYTQQLDISSDAITTKTFSITDTTSDSFKTSYKLAPGEHIDYTVQVVNAGEVDATLDMVAQIVAADGNEIKNLQLTVEAFDLIAQNTADSTAKKAVLSTSLLDGTTVLAKGETAVVTFRVTWNYANDAETNAVDNADMSAAASELDVSINAVGVAGTPVAIAD